MEKTVEIPEGYEARIEGNKVILEPKESEDERIRKQLIGFLSGRYALCNINTKDAIAYLERQKEQKPASGNSEKPNNHAEWSEEDEKFFKTALWHISYSVSNGKTTDDHCDTTHWLKGVKERLKTPCPSWKPSEEQMEVDLEKFADKIKTFQGRYKYPEIVSIKGAMAFMARMFYQYPNVARLWYDRLPKTTMA